jgi:hypothetical protein
MWDWKNVVSSLPQDIKEIWRLFLCGESVSRTYLQSLFGSPAIDFLIDKKILFSDHDQLKTHFALIKVGAFPIFVDLDDNPRLIIDEATISQVTNASINRKAETLVLYSSSGVDALSASLFSNRVVTHSADSHIESDVSINLLMNSRLSIACEQTFDTCNITGTFSHIISSPPYYISVTDSNLPPIFNGGSTGHTALLDTVKCSCEKLALGGSASICCIVFGKGHLPNILVTLEQLARENDVAMHALITTKLDWSESSPFWLNMLSKLAVSSGKSIPEILPRFLAHLSTHEIEAAYFVNLRLEKSPLSSSHTSVNLTNKYYGNWQI